MIQKLSINTKSAKEVVDITRLLNDLFMKNNYPEGVALIFLHHTSAAITIADLDPGTDMDYIDAFNEIIPKLPFRHPHNPEHTKDHILSAMIGVSLTVSVQSANMLLGQNQRVVLIEFDGPKERRISVSYLPLVNTEV